MKSLTQFLPSKAINLRQKFLLFGQNSPENYSIVKDEKVNRNKVKNLHNFKRKWRVKLVKKLIKVTEIDCTDSQAIIKLLQARNCPETARKCLEMSGTAQKTLWAKLTQMTTKIIRTRETRELTTLSIKIAKNYI